MGESNHSQIQTREDVWFESTPCSDGQSVTSHFDPNCPENKKIPYPTDHSARVEWTNRERERASTAEEVVELEELRQKVSSFSIFNNL